MSDLSGLSNRAVRGLFYLALEESSLPWIDRVAMQSMSDQGSEEYKWLGASPSLREWIGGRNAKGLRENGITIQNKTFESTLKFDSDDLRRDKTGQIQIRITDLASRVNAHWASLITSLIISNGTCYDGQNFFSAAHAEGKSGTIKNLLTASEVSALNVTTAAKPTAAELSPAIMGLIEKFYGFKDDQGEPINETAQSFTVMVPVNMWAAATSALSKDNLQGASGVVENVLRNEGFNVDIVVNPRLTSATELYVFRNDASTKAFIQQEEQGVSTGMIGEGSEHELLNNEQLFLVKAIRNVGYAFWQHGIKATLS